MSSTRAARTPSSASTAWRHVRSCSPMKMWTGFYDLGEAPVHRHRVELRPVARQVRPAPEAGLGKDRDLARSLPHHAREFRREPRARGGAAHRLLPDMARRAEEVGSLQ